MTRTARNGPTNRTAPHPIRADHAATADEIEVGPVTVLTAMSFLAGIWLVLAPFALDYQITGAGFDGSWNDIVIGVALAVVTLVRIAAPARTVALGLVNVALGSWLIIAPFLLGYNVAGADAIGATWNDIVVGAVVVALSLGSLLLASRAP
jgi:hypothetical protein